MMFRCLMLVALVPCLAVMASPVQESGVSQDHQTPAYKVLENYNEFEKREYKSGSKWVCTTMTTGDTAVYKTAEMFYKLFRYIGGNNDKNARISMGFPVNTLRTPVVTTSGDNTSRTMCFYIGDSYPEGVEAPQPKDDTVFIRTNNHSLVVYTRVVSGYMSDAAWVVEKNNLVKLVVAKNGLSVRQDEYFTNVYNAPWQMWSRRNEVWLVAN